MDNYIHISDGNDPFTFDKPIYERNIMENVEKKYVCIEINRPSTNYLFQVDKSVNLEELDDEWFTNRHLVDHDHLFDIREISEKSYFQWDGGKETERFLYKSGDDFCFGPVVPNNTKSIIQYHPKQNSDEDGNRVSGGKTIKERIEVFLSSTKEETKELWNKGDIKTLSNYFISNNLFFSSWSPKQYEPDDKGTLQLLYDEKDNPVVILLQDVETYQKEWNNWRNKSKSDLLK